jgi:hypothetical protein
MLASVQFLFICALEEHDTTAVKFATKSGVLTAKKVPAREIVGVSGEEKLLIEIDFPCDSALPVRCCRAAIHSLDLRRQCSQINR